MRNVNGRVRIEDAAAAGDARTVNGGVTVVFRREPGGACHFKTVNGDVEVDSRERPRPTSGSRPCTARPIPTSMSPPCPRRLRSARSAARRAANTSIAATGPSASAPARAARRSVWRH
ncbi:MAG: hypothetical protein M0C28_12270 [Candidatus Moduliflexus flocculans]|nr:hypothetical protein [Candidatus Moduliflexus flocculans]